MIKNIEKETATCCLKIVFPVPATQVTVERAFSTLKFVLSDKRANIEDMLLEDILLINLN